MLGDGNVPEKHQGKTKLLEGTHTGKQRMEQWQ